MSVGERPRGGPSLAERGSELLAQIEELTPAAPGSAQPAVVQAHNSTVQKHNSMVQAHRPVAQPPASLPLPGSHDDLIPLALSARQRAYAPYSSYQVGAAVRTADGRVFLGANVENASYGLAICAERAAVVGAVLAGARELVAVAVATQSSPPVAPCGMCRQTLAEFSRDLVVLLVNERGEEVRTTLDELLPLAFRSDDLAAVPAR